MDHTLDTIAPQLARWLAPYVADELQRRGFNPAASADYDEAACVALVREFGVNTLNRAADFFAKLEADGAVDSVTMAQQLGVGTPRNISSALTTPLKRHAKRLGLGLPWTEGVSAENRTVWRDRDGIAGRMRAAVLQEQGRRFGP